MFPNILITNKRKKRLINHLLELERRTGMPLRKEPRVDYLCCPVGNFAPDFNKDGKHRAFSTWVGVTYLDVLGHVSYIIYTREDSEWFKNLTSWSKKRLFKFVCEWAKNREV